MSHSLLNTVALSMMLSRPISLPLSIPLDSAAQQPRACRRTVQVEADTTVARVGPETATFLQYTANLHGPEFPAELRSLREGNVVAKFVVDTNGRVVDGTAHIVSESNRGFGQSVCTFLRRARFRTAAVNGRKLTVAVLAAPFLFPFGR